MEQSNVISVRATASLCIGLIGLYCISLAVIPLAGDEAYYWLWASLPRLGYVDHPPGVAWLGWVGGLFHSVFLFRLCGFSVVLLAFCWAARAVNALECRWSSDSWLALLVLLSSPLTSHFLVEMGPDSLLVFAWALCQKSLLDAVLLRRESGWWGLSLSLALAVYAKLTGWLAWAAALGWLVSLPEGRRELRRPRVWLQFCVSGLFLVPHFYWNFQHQWINYLFQFKLRKAAVVMTTANLLKPFETLADCGFLTLLMLPACWWAVRKVISSDDSGTQSRPTLVLLLWFSVPLQLGFAAFRLLGVGRWNWALPSYLGLSIIVVLWLRGRPRSFWTQAAFFGTLIWAIAAVTLRCNPNWVPDGSTLGQQVGLQPSVPSNLLRLRNSDFTAAYPLLGSKIASWRSAHSGFVMCDDYTEASALSYYSGGLVRLVAPFQEGSQFLLFNDYEQLLGQDALLVSRRKLEDLPHVLLALQRSFESYRRESPIEIDIGSRIVTYYPVQCHNLQRALLQSDSLGIRSSKD